MINISNLKATRISCFIRRCCHWHEHDRTIIWRLAKKKKDNHLNISQEAAAAKSGQSGGNFDLVGSPNKIVELISTPWLECLLALLTETNPDTVPPSITQRPKISMSTSRDALLVVNDQTACSNSYMPELISAGLGSSDWLPDWRREFFDSLFQYGQSIS